MSTIIIADRSTNRPACSAAQYNRDSKECKETVNGEWETVVRIIISYPATPLLRLS